MATRRSRRIARLLAPVILSGLLTASAVAQQDLSNQKLLEDFIHYARINQRDLAQSFGQALLGRSIGATDFVALVEEADQVERFQETVLRLQRVPELSETADALLNLYNQGKLDQARNADEIARNIRLLTGDLRARLVARERLIFAGEYATPQLLQALLDRNDRALQAAVREVLVDLGRHAINPLTAALFELDPASQETVVGILGEIPYSSSVPYLYELHRRTQVAPVRAAAERAIRNITGSVDSGVSIADLYRRVAEDYYKESASLTNFEGEEFQLVWDFEPQSGLNPIPVRTPVYHEAMAMRLCERALRIDGTSEPSLALWLAANLSREIDSPEGYENPVYPSTRRDAMYYAVAAGPASCQRVLARALDDRDTPLARRAISAIERTANSGALATGDFGRRPLLEALRYPNRRVQYEAALALAASQPRSEFDGSDRVVPILAGAVRDGGARYALVVATDSEQQQFLGQTLRSAGYTVLTPVRSLREAETVIAEIPSVDLIVTDLTSETTEQLIRESRVSNRLSAAPVLALVSAQGFADLAPIFVRDPLVRIARAGLSADQISASAEQLLRQSVGGVVGSDEAEDYRDRALSALRDLAVSGNGVLRVADAQLPLISALGETQGPVRLAVAEVLSWVEGQRAQVALADAALASSGAEQVALLDMVARSAKRFGNQLDPRQVNRLVSLAKSESGEVGTAAAALLGALSLPNAELLPLILEG